MSLSLMDAIEFELPRELEAHEPPEARGRARDDVRLMVSHVSDDVITHTHFRQLPDFLQAGDVVVVNASATINAAFDALRQARGNTESIRLHLSTPISEWRWVVELRRLTGDGTIPLLDAEAGERIRLAADAHVTLVDPFVRCADGFARNPVRLWVADLALPSNVLEYTAQHGFPIRYSYVQRRWPLSYYQTVFANEPGSAEMPSAGRPFTSSAVRRLQRKGVRVVPLILHAGIASLETDEPPYPERYRVARSTADAINEARAAGGRVVAVGTTVVRALETVASDEGQLRAGEGWTDLVITPERGLHIVDALLTGLHAPRATHLAMLTAFAGHDHLARAYDAALRQKYLWHEFGDFHLILPGGSASSDAVTGKWSDG